MEIMNKPKPSTSGSHSVARLSAALRCDFATGSTCVEFWGSGRGRTLVSWAKCITCPFCWRVTSPAEIGCGVVGRSAMA
eukprot:3606450-Rhodomonas_salina.1